MPNPFMDIRFHVAERSKDEIDEVVIHPRQLRAGQQVASRTSRTQFNNDETAARFYLSRVLSRDNRPSVRGLAAPGQPEVVPDMLLKSTQESSLTKTRLVTFEQARASIPIFGSHVVVEIDTKRQLKSISGRLAEVALMNPVTSISQQEALGSVARLCDIATDTLTITEAPRLTFYYDKKTSEWHLAYLFLKIPVAPQDFRDAVRGGEGKSFGHRLGPSPRQTFLQLNYLVDAHDGRVLFYYSATPTVTICRGVDEMGVDQRFYGLKIG